MRQVDLGVAFDAGCDFPFAENSLMVDIRYSLGMRKVANLNTVFKDSTDVVVYQNKRQVKTGVFSVVLGFTFP